METVINLKSFKNHPSDDEYGLLDRQTATLLDEVTIAFVSPDVLSSITKEAVYGAEYVHGHTSSRTNTIYIDNSLSVDMQRRAVSRELLEWCNGLYGLGLSHIQISVLGQFFHSLICHE